MKIINAGYEILTPIDKKEELKMIERVGRTCYKSESAINDGSTEKFARMLIDRGHEAMIEHSILTIKFICDRGVSHEIVRHRNSSYAMESTRYCNYSNDKFGKELTFIKPCFWDEKSSGYKIWKSICENSELKYMSLLKDGTTPQQARSILPNSLKTELVMTSNYREWRHFLKLRTAKDAHPQMREITIPLLKELQEKLPIIFGDIEAEK